MRGIQAGWQPKIPTYKSSQKKAYLNQFYQKSAASVKLCETQKAPDVTSSAFRLFLSDVLIS